jgi:hypothetical protein
VEAGRAGSGPPSFVGSSGASSGVRLKRVAIAFHGQFLSRADFSTTVQQILPPTWALPGGAEGGGGRQLPVAYDAFVATSTQRSEIASCRPLDGAEICGRLVSVAQFAYAQCDQRPYDPARYMRLAAQAGLPVRDAARYSLYPHRVLSSFSTMTRALRLVSAHARARAPNGGAGYYDLIALTRLDVFFHNVKLPTWPAGRSWLTDVAKAGIIGRRKSHKPLWEDRFIMGVPELMASLETLDDARVFAVRFGQLGNQSYPEAQIYHQLTTTGRVPLAGSYFTGFATIEGFKQNKRKFRRNFINVSAHAASAR